MSIARKIIDIVVPENVVLLPSDKPVRICNEGMGWDALLAGRLELPSRQASSARSEKLELSDHKSDSDS